MLGPLANPAGARRQVLGVFGPEWVEPFAQALLALGSDRAFVVHGRDGIDEISTTGPTLIAELKDGKVRSWELNPEDLGVTRAGLHDLRGGAAQENADALLRVLKGEPGPFADLVLANAAAALVVAGLADTLRAGVERARGSIADGRALAALEALKRASND
jgi:anthranilate phosphoribosyltransferase